MNRLFRKPAATAVSNSFDPDLLATKQLQQYQHQRIQCMIDNPTFSFGATQGDYIVEMPEPPQDEEEAAALKAAVQTKVDYWFKEIKAKEEEKAKDLPLIARWSSVLRNATEGKREDEQLRRELTTLITWGELGERDKLRREQEDLQRLEFQEIEKAQRESLIAEQERAFIESLKADQEKEALRAASEVHAQAEQDEAAERAQRLQTRPPPPEPREGEGVAKLVLRLPDGRRVQRRFMKNNTVQDLRDFVESEYFGGEFSLVCAGMPPGALDERAATLEQARLFPQPALITVKPSRD